MNKQQVRKLAYLAPCTMICPVRFESPMLADSPVSGGHYDAEDEGELNARQFRSDHEDGIWKNSSGLWED